MQVFINNGALQYQVPNNKGTKNWLFANCSNLYPTYSNGNAYYYISVTNTVLRKTVTQLNAQ